MLHTGTHTKPKIVTIVDGQIPKIQKFFFDQQLDEPDID